MLEVNLRLSSREPDETNVSCTTKNDGVCTTVTRMKENGLRLFVLVVKLEDPTERFESSDSYGSYVISEGKNACES